MNVQSFGAKRFVHSRRRVFHRPKHQLLVPFLVRGPNEVDQEHLVGGQRPVGHFLRRVVGVQGIPYRVVVDAFRLEHRARRHMHRTQEPVVELPLKIPMGNVDQGNAVPGRRFHPHLVRFAQEVHVGTNAEQALVCIEHDGFLMERGDLVRRDDQRPVRHRPVAQQPPHRNGPDVLLRLVHPLEVHDRFVNLPGEIGAVVDLDDQVGARRHRNPPPVRVTGGQGARLPSVDVRGVRGPAGASIEARQRVRGVQLRGLARDVHENVGVVHGRRQARHDLHGLDVPRVVKVGGHHEPSVLLSIGRQGVRREIGHKVHALQQRPLWPKRRQLHLHRFVAVGHAGVVPLGEQGHVRVAQDVLPHKVAVRRICRPWRHFPVLHHVHVHVGREEDVLVSHQRKRPRPAVVVAMCAVRVHNRGDVVHPGGQQGLGLGELGPHQPKAQSDERLPRHASKIRQGQAASPHLGARAYNHPPKPANSTLGNHAAKNRMPCSLSGNQGGTATAAAHTVMTFDANT